MRYYTTKGISVRAVSIKIGIGFVLAIGAAQLLQVRAVTDAFLLFVAAGVLPGTGVALSPNTMLWLLVEVVAGVMLLVFRKELVALVRPGQAESVPVPVPEEIVTSREPVAEQPPARPSLAARYAVLVSAQVNGLYVRLHAWRARLQQHATALYRWIAPRLANAWQWLLGQLSRLDRWATCQIDLATAWINQHEDLAAMLAFAKESARVLLSWTAKK